MVVARQPEMGSERDRKLFKARLKSQLSRMGISQRAMEERLGLSTGTLSKIFAGRLNLTVGILMELAKVLQIDPWVLVDDTAWIQLRNEVPLDKATEVELKLQAEVDELRLELVATHARERAAEEELAVQRRRAERSEARRAQWEERASQAAVERDEARADAAEQADAFARERAARREEAQVLQSLRRALAANEARLSEQAKQLSEARRRLAQAEKRATVNEQAFEKLTAEYWNLHSKADQKAKEAARLAQEKHQLSRQLQGQGGAVLGGAALAFLVGCAVGSSGE